MRVRAMREADAEAVAAFADRAIGVDYYPPDLVRAYLSRARLGDVTTAYVALLPADEGGRLVGFRIAFPPGRWSSGRGDGLSVARWPHPLEDAAYFQSCFVEPGLTGRGIGRQLADRALADLRRCGAKLVVAHSWKESPHGSSRRYLSRLGFEAVAEHPRYWSEVDYLCSGCRQPRCLCTAVEMVLDLEKQP